MYVLSFFVIYMCEALENSQLVRKSMQHGRVCENGNTSYIIWLKSRNCKCWEWPVCYDPLRSDLLFRSWSHPGSSALECCADFVCSQFAREKFENWHAFLRLYFPIRPVLKQGSRTWMCVHAHCPSLLPIEWSCFSAALFSYSARLETRIKELNVRARTLPVAPTDWMIRCQIGKCVCSCVLVVGCVFGDECADTLKL